MATINNPRLAISTDPLHQRANISVSCDVDFTDVEVNAMNLLGLRYRLECQLLNKDLWQLKPVAILDEWTFPRLTALSVSNHEHAVFNADRAADDLRRHLIDKDKLAAELKLRNEETGAEVVTRTELVEVDLTA